MSEFYGFNLSDQDQQLYAVWNNSDPPDIWEIERNDRIKAIQGVGNPFVGNYQQLSKQTIQESFTAAKKLRGDWWKRTQAEPGQHLAE